jgi:hypothetical protein
MLTIQLQYSCPSRSTLHGYIPTVLGRLRKEVMADLGDRSFTIFFDGASRRGELIVIVYRCIRDDLTSMQRLFSLHTEPKSVDGGVLARLVLSELAEHLGIFAHNSDRLVCTTHDSAAVNRAAMQQLVCCH